MSKQFPSELTSESALLPEREFDRFQCALCLKHKRATQVDHHGADWVCHKCRRHYHERA